MWMKKHCPCCFKKGPTRAFFTTRAWNTYEMSGKLLDRYMFLYYSWFLLSALWGLIWEVYTVSIMYLGSSSFRLGPRGVALALIFWIRFSKNPPRLPKRDWDLFRELLPPLAPQSIECHRYACVAKRTLVAVATNAQQGPSPFSRIPLGPWI